LSRRRTYETAANYCDFLAHSVPLILLFEILYFLRN
jgi:hypothetical protein